MSWFTQHRPRQVSQLHLTTVREQLLRLMKSGSFPHALLFAGPKGTGKTSSARIIAALLNDPENETAIDTIFFGKEKKGSVLLKEPDSKSSLIERVFTGNSFMVTEMDAASNRGIDDIRKLKERLSLPPQEGKVAVYILDEVHMLTTDAFNALLKVLEEPPEHVVFILATTELHKVPATIVSRCVQISFQRASQKEIIEALKRVLDAEKIAYEEPALSLIADRADGSFRDAVKLLETIAQGQKKVDETLVRTVLVDTTGRYLETLLQNILAKDTQAIADLFEQMRQANIDSQYFCAEWMHFLHHQFLLSLGLGEGKGLLSERIAHFMLTEFSQMVIQDGPIPLLSLELKALDIVYRSQNKKASETGTPHGPATTTKTLARASTTTTATSLQSSNPYPGSEHELSLHHESKVENSLLSIDTTLQQKKHLDDVVDHSVPAGALTHDHNGDGKQLVDRWNEFLDRLKDYNLSLELLLRSAQPVGGEKGKATIQVYYQFHKEQLQQPKFMNIIQECIQSVIGSSVDFEILVARRNENPQDANIKAVADSDLVELAKDLLV